MATPVPFEKYLACSPFVRHPSLRLVVNHPLIHGLIKLALVLLKDLLPLLMRAPATQLQWLRGFPALEICVRYAATRPRIVGIVHI